MRRALVVACIVAGGAMGTGETPAAQSAAGAATPAAIHVEAVQKNIYLLASAGSGNITVQVGSEGVLMVDSGIDRSASQVLSAIQKLSTGRVRITSAATRCLASWRGRILRMRSKSSGSRTCSTG
jgi:hypothetical protein